MNKYILEESDILSFLPPGVFCFVFFFQQKKKKDYKREKTKNLHYSLSLEEFPKTKRQIYAHPSLFSFLVFIWFFIFPPHKFIFNHGLPANSLEFSSAPSEHRVSLWLRW